MTLAAKISLAVVGVLLLAVVSSVVAIVSAFQFEAVQETLISENLASVRAAEELEIALLEQRGYVSSYILDGGNQRWLEELDHKGHQFQEWLARARQTARSPREHEILNALQQVQRDYTLKRDEVIRLFESGEQEAARAMLLGDVVDRHQESYRLCEDFIKANEQLVNGTTARVRRQVEQVTFVTLLTVVLTFVLGLALLWLLFFGVIFPLRRIAREANQAARAGDDAAFAAEGMDELRLLGQSVERLMHNVAETRSDLAASRVQLAHAEKLAAVGKLAASVAHEIRNPLTSMKMWLYSLRRIVGHDEPAREKLDVVSKEIIRLERILGNFLEFSRPPSLRLLRQQLPRLTETTLELLKYRLEERQIVVTHSPGSDLPEVLADTEQLKQVFVNLLSNALEASPAGGCIVIEYATTDRAGQEMLEMTIRDCGPGIPKEIRSRVFEPFFTTKSEGTGLGLCIAASIIARHGGSLLLEDCPVGTQWNVLIPTAARADDRQQLLSRSLAEQKGT